MSQQNMQRPQTPPLDEIGDMDFNEAFGRNNGAQFDTPDRSEVVMKRQLAKKRPMFKKSLSTPNFNDWTKMVDEKISKKGGKTKKRKTRSRKQKKTQKKKTKKRKTKKGGEIGEIEKIGEIVNNPIHEYHEKKREEKREEQRERDKRSRRVLGPRPLYPKGGKRKTKRRNKKSKK